GNPPPNVPWLDVLKHAEALLDREADIEIAVAGIAADGDHILRQSIEIELVLRLVLLGGVWVELVFPRGHFDAQEGRWRAIAIEFLVFDDAGEGLAVGVVEEIDMLGEYRFHRQYELEEITPHPPQRPERILEGDLGRDRRDDQIVSVPF